MNLKNINEFDISIISDPHLLDSSLIGDTESLAKELKVERKLIVESESIFKKALDLVDKAKSNFLIIPGDLTKEGEFASHKTVSEILKEWKAKSPDRKIFIIPGNHDINSKKAYDYRLDEKIPAIKPKDFLNIYDFVYEDSAVLEMYKDSQIFKDYLKDINTKYQRESEYSYYAHGYLSYVARVKKDDKYKNGLTIIMLDTSIYSADKEQNHRDGTCNVVGSVSLEQYRWMVKNIDQAKERNDMVIVVAHHAFLPNFRNQELVFSPFIIKEYRDKFVDTNPKINGKTPIEILADMDVKFIFTGHLHENGTAKYISEMGNEIYDIQTGSIITYPLPIRHIKVDNKTGESHGFEVYITTELIREFSYMDERKNKIDVPDAIMHTLENQLSLREVIHNYIRIQANNPKLENLDIKREIINQINANFRLNMPSYGYINNFVFPKIKNLFPIRKKLIGRISLVNEKGEFVIKINSIGNTLSIRANNIEDALDEIFKQAEKNILYPPLMIYYIEKILNKIFKMPIDDQGHTFYDFSNYIYQYRSNTKDRPKYIDIMIDKLNDRSFDIINELVDYAKDEINEAFDYVTSKIKFKKNGSKSKFYNDLIQTEGITSNLAYKFVKLRVNNLRELLDLFSRFITKKRHIQGIDFAKSILHSKLITKFKMDFSDKMFGQKSLRKFITDMIGEMNDEMAEIYQNDDGNELDYYFNYIEYDESENI